MASMSFNWRFEVEGGVGLLEFIYFVLGAIV